jgi:hypothetical protein
VVPTKNAGGDVCRRSRGSTALRLICGAALGLIVLGTGCTPEDVPDSPLPVAKPEVASITVEYRQPNYCANVTSSCDGSVVFYGSWMRSGGEIRLTNVPGSFVWTATVNAVPVNFPPPEDYTPGNPMEGAYFVRIYDPFLRDTATSGVSGRRIRIGGQTLTILGDPDTSTEVAWVYVDANGVGHNPF